MTVERNHATGYDEATAAVLVDEAAQIVARYPQARSALLPMLHLVQAQDGYVSPRGIAFCAAQLGLTVAQVSAVATFYTQYKRHPNGTYTVGVCTNTLCAVMGGDAIWDEVAEHLGIGHDETTPDGAITLERIECNAACDYAPVVMVNWEFFDNQTPASTVALVDELRAGTPVVPTRGADTVATFREVSHVLAGFPDGRANEGVGAGVPTVRGTLLAREQGWSAPALPGAAAPKAPASKAPAAPAPAAGAPTAKAPAAPAPAVKAPAAPAKAPVAKAPARRPSSAAKAPAVPDKPTLQVGEPQSSAAHPEPLGETETEGTELKRRAPRKES